DAAAEGAATSASHLADWRRERPAVDPGTGARANPANPRRSRLADAPRRNRRPSPRSRADGGGTRPPRLLEQTRDGSAGVRAIRSTPVPGAEAGAAGRTHR